MPGALKNALDWLVGGSEFIDKPVALLNASPRATHAQASLRETITTMSGHLVDEDAIANDAQMATALRKVLAAFVRAIESWGTRGEP